MALVRWQPANIFDLGRDADRLFDSFWGNGGRGGDTTGTAAWRPSVDIAENKDEYVVTADLPGISRDDLEVTVDDGRLTIRGERRQNAGSDDGPARHVERTYGSSTRSFDLPTAVESEGIGAAYRDGVLTVTVPKAEAAKPRQIEVQVSA
ncbi:MAG TPA: Hsp20/alpha crystallin family protein [Candidatus Latescibacteria bacterium]|nr:Hsp20/alpha crystallin family protein [Candidatus Latescibacterota bacterium]